MVVLRGGEVGVAARVPPRRVAVGDLGGDLEAAEVELLGHEWLPFSAIWGAAVYSFRLRLHHRDQK